CYFSGAGWLEARGEFSPEGAKRYPQVTSMALSFRESRMHIALCVGLGVATVLSAGGTAAQGAADAAVADPGATATTPLGRPSLVGRIGLFGTSTAEVGPVHQLRLGLHTEYFSASDLLIAG